jgi:hypothetical protein
MKTYYATYIFAGTTYQQRFQADDMSHAVEQAEDALNKGERLVAVELGFWLDQKAKVE